MAWALMGPAGLDRAALGAEAVVAQQKHAARGAGEVARRRLKEGQVPCTCQFKGNRSTGSKVNQKLKSTP